MPSILDTTGLSCPQPMLLVKTFLEATDADTVTVLADCEASRENISRLARSMQWQVTVDATGKHLFTLHLERQKA